MKHQRQITKLKGGNMKSRIFTWMIAMALLTALAMPVLPEAQEQSAQEQSATQEGKPEPVHYTVTDLGAVGGPPGQPFVIKNTGLISGAAAVAPNVWHAVLWYRGRKVDIGTPGLGGPSTMRRRAKVSSAAFGVNERGQAVGEAETPYSDPNGEDFCGFASQHRCLPFLWQNGVMTPLPRPADNDGAAGHNGVANAINVRGEIAGVAENTVRDSTCPAFDPALGQYQVFQFKPVIWEKGKARELPTFGGDPDGIAFSINDNGQAAGASGTCTSFQANADLTYLFGLHATLWHNDTVTDLGNLGGVAPGFGNVAITINNRGQVVGDSGTSDGTFHGFLWTKETGIQDLGTVPGDIASVALGINDEGDVVGISFDPSFTPRAYIRQNGVMTDLNTLIPPDSPLYLLDACSINCRGEIIGLAVNGSGEAHGFLAKPTRCPAGSENPSAGSNTATRPALSPEDVRTLLQQRLSFGRFGVPLTGPR
jgi:probable HAF family extracellular repeat protein